MTTELPEILRTQEAEAEATWKAAYAEPEAAAESPPTTDPAPAPAAETPTAPAEDEWKHRYDVLCGKYNAEVPRLHDEVRYWRDQAALAAQQHQPETGVNADAALVDLLGDDAAKAVTALLESQKAEFEAKLQQTQQLGMRSAQDRFWDKVRAAFPNYGEMQNDPALNAWLGQSWPGSRQTRLQEANAAFSNMDADAFIALLQAYSPAAAPVAPAPRTPPPPTPRRAAGSGTPPPDKQPFSPAGYQQQMNRVIQLRSNGRYAEADALEKSLDAAASESLRPA